MSDGRILNLDRRPIKLVVDNANGKRSSNLYDSLGAKCSDKVERVRADGTVEILKNNYSSHYSAQMPKKGTGWFYVAQQVPKGMGNAYLRDDLLEISGDLHNGKIVKIANMEGLDKTSYEHVLKMYESMLSKIEAGKIKVGNCTKRFIKKAIEFCKTRI